MFEVTKYIEIDAAHRVPLHGSKCRNLHGHRYRIEAQITSSALWPDGVQQGMVMDFSFIKELLNQYVDHTCDHGLIVSKHDPLFSALVGRAFTEFESDSSTHGFHDETGELLPETDPRYALRGTGVFGKVYVLAGAPTAENMAQHFFAILAPLIDARSEHRAFLKSVKVYETPTCTAVFHT